MIDNLEIRSEPVKEIISRKPGIFIRISIPLIVISFLLLIVGSWFIRYPETVSAKAKVIEIDAPKEMKAGVSGKITTIFIKEGEEIHQGQIVGVLESSANFFEVQKICSSIDTIKKLYLSLRYRELIQYCYDSCNLFYHLGELQEAHQTFIQSFVKFSDYISPGLYSKKKELILSNLSNTIKLHEVATEQMRIQKEDLELILQNFKVNDTLLNERLINPIDFRSKKSILLNKMLSIPQSEAALISNRTQQNQLKDEILEVDNSVKANKDLFAQSINVYQHQLEEWKNKFLLIAPASGKLVYNGFIEEKQQVEANQTVFFVTNLTNQYFVEILIPQTNFGKINVGQNVLLKFKSYPFEEFGGVIGKIGNIKGIPSDSGFLAKVLLPDKLVTTTNKEISIKGGLFAEADIIVEDQRLYNRLLGGVFHLH